MQHDIKHGGQPNMFDSCWLQLARNKWNTHRIGMCFDECHLHFWQFDSRKFSQKRIEIQWQYSVPRRFTVISQCNNPTNNCVTITNDNKCIQTPCPAIHEPLLNDGNNTTMSQAMSWHRRPQCQRLAQRYSWKLVGLAPDATLQREMSSPQVKFTLGVA